MELSIYTKVSGSLINDFGDDTLLYCEGTSIVAEYVSGLYMDSMHELSEQHATVIWKRFDNADRYVYVEVQGGFTQFVAESRSYSQRSSSEVSLADVNLLLSPDGKHIDFGTLFSLMPELRQYAHQQKAEPRIKVPPAHAQTAPVPVPAVPAAPAAAAPAAPAAPVPAALAPVPAAVAPVPAAAAPVPAAAAPVSAVPSDWSLGAPSPAAPPALAAHLLAAILRRKRLYVALSVEGREDLYGSALRKSSEFKTIAAALELLPAGFARYVSFAFCADDQHRVLLDDVLLVVYVKGALSVIPQDAWSIDWAEAVSPLKIDSLDYDSPKAGNIASLLPGSNGSDKVLGLEEMFDRVAQINKHYDAIQQKHPAHDELAEADWHIWLLEHNIAEVHCSGWQELKRCVARAPEAVRSALFEQHKPAAQQWPLEPVMKSLLPAMHFDEKVLNAWREAKWVEYLETLKGRAYGFLFADSGFNFQHRLTPKFVEQLECRMPGDDVKQPTASEQWRFLDRWVSIFEEHDALDNTARRAFAERYSRLPFRHLDEVVRLMAHLNTLCEGFDEKTLRKTAKAIPYDSILQLPCFAPNELKGLTANQKVWVRSSVRSALKKYKESRLATIPDFLALAYEDKPSATEERLMELFTAEDICRMLNAVYGQNSNDYARCCEQLLIAGRTLSKNYRLKGVAENVCYDGVLASFIEKCSSPAGKKNASAQPDWSDYSKWDVLNAKFCTEDGKVEYRRAWFVLYRLFAINVAEMKNTKQLLKLFDQICSKCTDGFSEANVRHLPFAGEVRKRIKALPNINLDNLITMEEKYFRIFTNLDDDAESVADHVEKGEDLTEASQEEFWPLVKRLYTEFTWAFIGLAALVVFCVAAPIAVECSTKSGKVKQHPVVEQTPATIPADTLTTVSTVADSVGNADEIPALPAPQ